MRMALHFTEGNFVMSLYSHATVAHVVFSALPYSWLVGAVALAAFSLRQPTSLNAKVVCLALSSPTAILVAAFWASSALHIGTKRALMSIVTIAFYYWEISVLLAIFGINALLLLVQPSIVRTASRTGFIAICGLVVIVLNALLLVSLHRPAPETCTRILGC